MKRRVRHTSQVQGSDALVDLERIRDGHQPLCLAVHICSEKNVQEKAQSSWPNCCQEMGRHRGCTHWMGPLCPIPTTSRVGGIQQLEWKHRTERGKRTK